DQMNRRTLDQPGMAVEPAALIPPALEHAGIDAHRDDVRLAAEMRQGRQVDIGAVVTAPVVAHDIAVEPDGGVGRHALELKLDIFAAVRRRESEALAVPADAFRMIALRHI